MVKDINRSKIDKTKIMRWRLELMQHSYNIVFRAGNHKQAPDALSWVHCASM